MTTASEATHDERNTSLQCPRLLVSVRDEREAVVALRGGAQIIDVKEPSRGSLGMSDVETIRRIVQTVRAEPAGVPISAALGEVQDWRGDSTVPRLPRGLDFVKLGLARLGSFTNWPARYRETRTRFEKEAGYHWKWVAVAYADWQIAQAPPPLETVSVAAELNTSVVLIDTYFKDSRRLTDWISVEQLTDLANVVHLHGMKLALAGRLTHALAPKLASCCPDILAIRSAAVPSEQRESRIDEEAVRSFRGATEEAFHGVCGAFTSSGASLP